ncbi:MAG: endolytic transglycosylase MltG [bacterium]|nr:endolytic transglycosylase MltG [bacterium]
MTRWLPIILVAIVIFTAPPAAYFVAPVNSAAAPQKFVVEKGDGMREIAAALEKDDLIKSPAAFVVYSVASGSAGKLKAGTYELSKAMNVFRIVDSLHAGPKEDISILVREGETLAEIEAKLVKAGIVKAKTLSRYPGKSLEGFLFPDTYRFFPNSPVDSVVKRFFTNFYNQAVPALKDSKRDFYETLIIASILEKEVPFHDDRKLVAGLLYKRLKIGMALQVDAAPETYDHPGLPKKPIANPGLDAIRAAANPQASEYLYYLSDPKTYKTIFSKDFDEHVQNKFKYLR